MIINIIDTISGTTGINVLDVTSVIILIIGGLIGYKRGLVLSVFSAFSWIISMILSSTFYPEMSKWIREKTEIFDNVKMWIINTVDFSSIFSDVTTEATRNIQSKQIESMNLPQNLINSFLENNNPEVYIALGVDNFEEYISSFVANGIINILAFVIVFIIIMSIVKLMGETLNFVAKLPVINTFNKFGGVIAGLIPAIMIIWIMITILSITFATSEGHIFFLMLESSKIVEFIGESNPIMEMITTVFP